MNVDLTNFNNHAKPLLKLLAESFPASLKIDFTVLHERTYENDEEYNAYKGAVYFLLKEGVIREHTNVNFVLTDKGVELINGVSVLRGIGELINPPT